MKKRVLKGGAFLPLPTIGVLLILPMIGGSLISIHEYIWGGLLIVAILLMLMIREGVELDFERKTITFYVSFYRKEYKASKFQKCKIKRFTKSYDISSGRVAPTERSYSVTKKALYIADIIHKEEKRIKVSNHEDLLEIVKELEEHFGIIRVR